MFSITTNIAAMDVYRYLAINTAAANQAMERLSSGYRINSAADDPAGLAISDGLQSQIDGMTQAVQNTQDGIDVLQTADGGLTQSTAILQQMLTLAVQASNTGSSDPTAVSADQTQISDLTTQLDKIASDTAFNGTPLLDGTYTGQTFQIGPDAGDTSTVSIASATSSSLGVSGLDVTTSSGASSAITAINNAITQVANQEASLGGTQNAFQYQVDNLNNEIDNTTSSLSTIRDADMAQESTNLASAQLLEQSDAAMLAQANSFPQTLFKFLLG